MNQASLESEEHGKHSSKAASFREMLDHSHEFHAELTRVKRSIEPNYPWYPYESMANLCHISDLLRPVEGDIIHWIPQRTALDLGCGDGDLAFFLERGGFSVDAVDCARTNFNALQGMRFLMRHLKSAVRLHELDLDGGCGLPPGEFGLALCLGLLYHLKNPILVMEQLAKQCQYCILSTRILTKVPGSVPWKRNQPLAYLLAADELNNDNSNYWLFTESALSRLLERTGWKTIATRIVVQETSFNDQFSTSDARIFMLLGSRAGLRSVRLLKGWYARESSGWQWTAQSFDFLVPMQPGKDRWLTLAVFIPQETVSQGKNRLTVHIDGRHSGNIGLDQPDRQTLSIPIPETSLSRSELLVQCSLDRPTRGAQDARILGLLVGEVYCR